MTRVWRQFYLHTLRSSANGMNNTCICLPSGSREAVENNRAKRHQVAHLCCISELYSSDTCPAQVNIQMSDDLNNCSKNIRLEVFVQQIGRRIDDEYNVGLLTTLNDRFCHKIN